MPVIGLPTMLEGLLECLLNDSQVSSYKIHGNEGHATLVIRFNSIMADKNMSSSTPISFRRKAPSQVKRDQNRRESHMLSKNVRSISVATKADSYNEPFDDICQTTNNENNEDLSTRFSPHPVFLEKSNAHSITPTPQCVSENDNTATNREVCSNVDSSASGCVSIVNTLTIADKSSQHVSDGESPGGSDSHRRNVNNNNSVKSVKSSESDPKNPLSSEYWRKFEDKWSKFEDKVDHALRVKRECEEMIAAREARDNSGNEKGRRHGVVPDELPDKGKDDKRRDDDTTHTHPQDRGKHPKNFI